MQDGIVTKSLWEKLDEGLATREKSKQQLAPDDEKMWTLEILTTAPYHNASFLLLTSMLQNIANHIVEASKPDPSTPRSSLDLPGSPQVAVRRKTLSKVPEKALRQLINRNYATVFAEAMFRTANVDNNRMKEKEKTVRKERMIKVVELFLDQGG